MALEGRLDAAGHEAEGVEAAGAVAAVELVGEEDVGELGLAVARPGVVLYRVVKVEVFELDAAAAVA